MESKNRIGDLLVRFGNSSPIQGRWGRLDATPVSSDSDGSLVVEPPRKGWAGYPCSEYSFSGWRIWVVGELYGIGRSPSAEREWLEQLVSGRVNWASLNGHVAVLGWDSTRAEWHVWTDRFGSMHLFYCPDSSGPLLGTSFHSVSCNQSISKLDWAALAGFFGCGFFPDDRTHFESVRILKPATETVFNAKGVLVRARRYWDWYHRPEQGRDFVESSEEFGRLFLKVMGEMTDGDRVAVPISGGLDSRSTLAGLGIGGQGLPPTGKLWSYSYGYSDDSIETRISSELAACRGLPFERFTIQPYLESRLDNIVGCIEGFQDILQCRQAFVADELAKHSDYVIAAHWGDVWHDDMGFSEIPGKDGSGVSIVDHTFSKMAKRGRRWLWDNLRPPSGIEWSPESTTREFVERGMERIQGVEDGDFRVKAFKTDNWSFRWTLSSIRMFQAAGFPRLPFYDARICDFFLTVPTSMVSGRKMQLEFLRKFAPDLSKVIWQETGLDLFNHGEGRMVRLLRRVVRRLKRELLGNRVFERNWEVQLGGEAGRKILEDHLLRKGLVLHDLFEQRAVQRLVQDFLREPLVDGRGYTVSMLLSLSAWLERRTARGVE